jgi:hypothetical protein
MIRRPAVASGLEGPRLREAIKRCPAGPAMRNSQGAMDPHYRPGGKLACAHKLVSSETFTHQVHWTWVKRVLAYFGLNLYLIVVCSQLISYCHSHMLGIIFRLALSKTLIFKSSS